MTWFFVIFSCSEQRRNECVTHTKIIFGYVVWVVFVRIKTYHQLFRKTTDSVVNFYFSFVKKFKLFVEEFEINIPSLNFFFSYKLSQSLYMFDLLGSNVIGNF